MRAPLMPAAAGTRTTATDRPVTGSARAGRTEGERLPSLLQGDLSRRFGFDFGRVRIFADDAADRANRAIGARAHAVGDELLFARGEYRPESPQGRALLAHELTHVVQAHRAPHAPAGISPSGSSTECEAHRVAAAIAADRPVGAITATPTAAIHRQPAGVTIIDVDIISGPTDYPQWVDKQVTAAGYTIWLGGYMLFLAGMPIVASGGGIRIPESHVDFTLQSASPINNRIYDSHALATAAVAAAPQVPGVRQFAYYWGAGGLVIVPTLIGPATAPKATATMWSARIAYANYVQQSLAGLALGMVGGKLLGSAYGWARAGGGGNRPIAGPKLDGGGQGKDVAPPPPAKVTPPSGQVDTMPPSVRPAAPRPPAGKPAPATTAAPKQIPPEEFVLGDKPSGPDVFTRVARSPGGQAEKVKTFERLGAELRQRTAWRADRTGDATDGSVVYHGEAQSKALVIKPDGSVYTGTWGQHVKLTVTPGKGPQLVCDWELPGWKLWQ